MRALRLCPRGMSSPVERIRARGGFSGLKVVSERILPRPAALPLARSTRSAFLCHLCTSLALPVGAKSSKTSI